MAEYQAIHGFTVQNRTSDHLAPGISCATWAAGGNANNLDSERGGSAGTQTAAITFGGNNPSNTAINEQWNGSSWTEVGDLNTARSNQAGCGQTTLALCFGGNVSPKAQAEEWDGSSWTEVGDLNTGRQELTGSGISAPLALAIGGSGDTDKTEQWNGSAWTEVGDLSTARNELSSAVQSGVGATAAFGGHTSTHVANTEEWTIIHAIKTVTTS